jgi:hypothetical protein
MEQLHGRYLEAPALEAGDYVAHDAALYSIRLYHDKSPVRKDHPVLLLLLLLHVFFLLRYAGCGPPGQAGYAAKLIVVLTFSGTEVLDAAVLLNEHLARSRFYPIATE